jgi:hypothetical protein
MNYTRRERQFGALRDAVDEGTAHLMAATEHAAEARRLVDAGVRAGIVRRLYSVAINREIDKAHQEARLAWGCNVRVAGALTGWADVLHAQERPTRTAVA